MAALAIMTVDEPLPAFKMSARVLDAELISQDGKLDDLKAETVPTEDTIPAIHSAPKIAELNGRIANSNLAQPPVNFYATNSHFPDAITPIVVGATQVVPVGAEIAHQHGKEQLGGERDDEAPFIQNNAAPMDGTMPDRGAASKPDEDSLTERDLERSILYTSHPAEAQLGAPAQETGDLPNLTVNGNVESTMESEQNLQANNWEGQMEAKTQPGQTSAVLTPQSDGHSPNGNPRSAIIVELKTDNPTTKHDLPQAGNLGGEMKLQEPDTQTASKVQATGLKSTTDKRPPGPAPRGSPNGVLPAKPSMPLRVIIVGAGIGGLTAAASLRQAGHDVTIFEQSWFSSEIGAAIHVGPNASRLLRKLGYNPKRMRGVPCGGFTMYDSTGKILIDRPNDHIIEKFKSPWYLSHRVDLHSELKQLALDPWELGEPAKLFLGSKVTQIEENEGIVTLEGGETHHADLVVAADGIHSIVREILFDPTKPTRAGIAAYRFVVDSNKIFNNLDCLPMKLEDGRCRVIFDKEKRVVIYPCRDNTLLNFVCMHPSEVNDGTSQGWNTNASAADVVETFKEFSPLVVNILKMAENVKCWQLLQRNTLSSWIKGRVCLIGDAAHPMLPHQGQGGGMAMEDGASLGPLFTFGTRRENVLDVLKLYQQVRHSRASKVQWLSETQYVGKQGDDPQLVQKYIFEHDVIEFAKHTRSSEFIT